LDPLPSGVPEPGPADRLDAAAWLVATAAAVVVLALVVAAGDGLRRAGAPSDQTLRLYRAVGLNAVALTPVGRREGGSAHPATTIDRRFLPSLPPQDPGRIRLLDAESLLRPAEPPS
jgi:hypothetical protein